MSSLATAANYSEHCSNVANGIFLRRFAGDTINFTNAEQGSFAILKHFGHSISKLSLNFYRNNSRACTSKEVIQYEELLQSVFQYSRNSLIEFEINYNSDCEVNIFQQFKQPFDRVEKVSLKLKMITVKTDNLRLCTIFPRVHQLELNFESISDPKFVDCEYRSLDELSVGGRLLDKSFDDTFKNLLKQNKRIRWLSITSPTYRTFHLVNKHLQNLEELHIQQSIRGEETEEISLPRLKRLDIRLRVHECSLPKRIKFSHQLEELVLHCAFSDIDEYYFEFLSKFPV